MLTSGRLEPDAPLGIDRLAHDLGVSPTPVREALARLEHTGLVVRRANRGYRVAPPMSSEQVAELVDARVVLECAAVERAMKDLPSLVRDLRVALREHEAAAERVVADVNLDDISTVQDYFVKDWAFHQVILDHSRNHYISRAVNELGFSAHRMRQTLGEKATDAAVAVSEHRSVLRGIETGDVSEGLAAMREHLHQVAVRSSPPATAAGAPGSTPAR